MAAVNTSGTRRDVDKCWRPDVEFAISLWIWQSNNSSGLVAVE
jgi:hypothetical protein